MKFIGFALICALLTACASAPAPLESLSTEASSNVPKAGPTKVSLLLPLQGDFTTAAQAIRDGYLHANYQANMGDDMALTVTNSQTSTNILSLYQQTLAEAKPDLIVGPLIKAEVNALAAQSLLATPVLALNQAEGDVHPANNFYQFSLDPQAEARLVAQRLHLDGYQQVFVIAPAGNWGQSISASFGKAWLTLGGKIVNSTAYQKAQDFTPQAQLLFDNTLVASAQGQTAVLLVANAADARVIVPIIRHQPMPLVIYGMPMIYSGVPNPAANAALNGVIFPSTHWQLDAQSTARQDYARLYPDASEDALRLYGFGMDAFSLAHYYLTKHSFSGLNIDGYSGQLTLSDNGVINRQLVWASFNAGIASSVGS